MDQVQLEYDGKTASFNASREVYAPAEYSYRCHSVTSFRYPQLTPRSAKDNANDWRVAFDDFQVWLPRFLTWTYTMLSKKTTVMELKFRVKCIYVGYPDVMSQSEEGQGFIFIF